MEVHYGIFAEELEIQANRQGLTLGEKTTQLEKIRHSINIVGFHVATESQIQSMLKKLNKMMGEALRPIEEENNNG